MRHKVFVYGNLQAGHCHNLHFLRGLESKTAMIKGRFYNIDTPSGFRLMRFVPQRILRLLQKAFNGELHNPK